MEGIFFSRIAYKKMDNMDLPTWRDVMSKPKEEANAPEATNDELGAEELEGVSGGALLLPAVQKVRDFAAATGPVEAAVDVYLKVDGIK